MSLDCYPLGKRRTIELREQPMCLDVAYNDDLFVSVIDQNHTIAVFDLRGTEGDNLIRKFKLAADIVLDQIIYCATGDYLGCVGYKGEIVSVYTIFDWRQTSQEPTIHELDVNVQSDGQTDRRDNLNNIDCCQRTGNLAISCGDTILVYKYVGGNDDGAGSRHRQQGDKTSADSSDNATAAAAATNGNDPTGSPTNAASGDDDGETPPSRTGPFEHIINIKLTIRALKICLLENYLSIVAVDHVQILKLELLTLQLQSDGFDPAARGQLGAQTTTNGQTNSSGSDPISGDFEGAQSETISTSTSMASMVSDTNSITTTNFSSFNNNNNTGGQLNNSDMSVITLDNQQQHQQPFFWDYESEITSDSNQFADDCITWNLNTKKLVKLPTLMHNTSTNLSSYHVCHPLELLGPASESIACRVSAAIYSRDFSQNQLEAVVMLCKQFDSDKDPVKAAHLQAVYLSSYDDQKRLTVTSSKSGPTHQATDQPVECSKGCDQTNGGGVGSGSEEGSAQMLLKSNEHELIASVTCFVSTLASCFVYSLHGKKVTRSQVITHPDFCLDLRPDLLNMYLLTPLGLQICSSGICDSTFRYDWSSSADLNLSFIATNRARILTSAHFVVLVACSLNGSCLVETMEKPGLVELYNRIVHTVHRCSSISIRSNLLTYLHASAHLALLAEHYNQQRAAAAVASSDDDNQLATNGGDDWSPTKEIVHVLKTVTIMLCKQLLQKKQNNVITNGKIDKAIKHLLDISLCDLVELTGRSSSLTAANLATLPAPQVAPSTLSSGGGGGCVDEDERPVDTDYELIKIYTREHQDHRNHVARAPSSRAPIERSAATGAVAGDQVPQAALEWTNWPAGWS